MKFGAKWKPENTLQMIELLHDEITLLHFKDFRRALYGGDNYRLVENKKRRYNVSKDNWRKLSDT